MRRAPVLLIAALIGLVTGCAQQVNSPGPKGVPLVVADQLTVCTHLSYAPFQSVRDGQIVGFDVDLIDLVADDLGLPQKIIDTSFEAIQSGASYNSGQCDIGTGGMTITPVRKENIDFSIPYLDSKQALLSRTTEPVHSLEQLRGKNVGVLVGTTGEEYVRKWDAAHGHTMRIVQFDEMTLQLTAVRTRQVDASIQDEGPEYDFARKNADLSVTASFSTGEQLGFGVAKGNVAMRKEIDRMLREARRNGIYDRLLKRWFSNS